jgi:hypothetical protein
MPTGYVGPNGQWVEVADQPQNAASVVPIVLTAAQIAAPDSATLANIFATFQLDEAPFTRYRSNGTALVGVGA